MADEVVRRDSRRKTRVGVVISDKMDKTVVIKISRRVKDPRYGKIINRSSNLKVHDEKNECKAGDVIEIMETRPISKDKRWRLVRIVKVAQ